MHRGETVAVVGECQFCGEAPSRRLGTKCEACDRQRVRMSKVVSPLLERGLTTCCQKLPHVTRGVYYCAECPGEGKVPIVLMHDGREVTAYHLPLTAVAGEGHGLTVEDLAHRRGVAMHELALRVTDARDFGLRRLRSVVAKDLADKFVVVRKKCEQCDDKIVRRVVARSKGSVRYCERCHHERRLVGLRRRRNRYRAARAPRQCPECPRVRRFVGARCYGCARSLQANGRCECGKIKVRAYSGGAACPECVPLQRRRKTETVDVTVTDGEQFRTIQVAISTPLSGVRAQTWIAPLVLIDDIHRTNPRVASGSVVAGVAVRGTGPSSRAVLPLLAKTRSRTDADVIARRELGADSGRQVVVALAAAGLVDEHGLTPRARAVLAWCRAAGVKL